MKAGILTLRCRLHCIESLKQKRSVVKRLLAEIERCGSAFAASEVGDQERLDNLYLLTVADMRATSPKVWNDWKGKLLSDLYHHTSRALRRGIGAPIDAETKIREIQAETLDLLKPSQAEAIPGLWDLFDPDYFLRSDA